MSLQLEVFDKLSNFYVCRPSKVPVFNLTCSEKKRITWGTVLNEGKRLNYEFPFEGLIHINHANVSFSKLHLNCSWIVVS